MVSHKNPTIAEILIFPPSVTTPFCLHYKLKRNTKQVFISTVARHAPKDTLFEPKNDNDIANIVIIDTSAE
jgi:hypothetical protein